MSENDREPRKKKQQRRSGEENEAADPVHPVQGGEGGPVAGTAAPESRAEAKASTAEGAKEKPAKKKAAGKKAGRKKASRKAALPTKKMLAEAELERMTTAPMSQCSALESLAAVRFPAEAMRLGFAVKVMGQPGLKSNDTRRWQAGPHLRVSLGYLCEIFAYLRRHGIPMYRMSSDLAPYATHPTMPQFHSMVKESSADLAHIGRLAREQDLRLSFHPSQFIVLNSENEELTRKSMWDLESQAEMLDRMECGPEAILVVHVGGAYGDRESGWRRWAATWPRLGEPVRRRLVLENDDIRYSAADVLKVHEATGVKCVWDYQHHWCFNPEGLEMGETLRRFVATWPAGVRPKMHFSCARTEMREIKRKNRKSGKIEVVLQPPIWTGHADYNNPFESIQFLRSIVDVDVDVMLESKAKDLSLIRLRNDIARYAPDLAQRYGIDLASEVEDVAEIVETPEEEQEALRD